MAIQDVPIGEKAPQIVNVIIEIPRGTRRNKYEMDKDMGMLVLDRVNATNTYYPYDYGYVPNTLCDDGDPLDALVIIDEPLVSGVVVPARVIGVMNLVDEGEGDEKLICVPAKDISKDHIKSVEDLGPEFKNQVKHHYTHLKDWKNNWQGVSVEVNGWGDAEEAYRVIEKAQKSAH